MIKPTKRKAFNFLRSYFDVLNELENDKDRLGFLLAVINKQFLDEDPKKLNFIVNLCYESQRHQIESSVKGWERASKHTLGTTPSTTLGATLPTDPKEEEEEEEEKVEYTKQSKIDFTNLLKLINKYTSRDFRVINKTIQAKYLARLKDGYSKSDIVNSIKNSVNDQFHKDNNFKYLTPDYFSRAKTLDSYSQEIKQQTKVINHTNPVN